MTNIVICLVEDVNNMHKSDTNRKPLILFMIVII